MLCRIKNKKTEKYVIVVNIQDLSFKTYAFEKNHFTTKSC